jgi:hypothetical protein
MPPAEFAETGVYCTGDDCHKIQAKWERPLAEVTPPRSSVRAVWTVPGFGSGRGSGGANARIHFGDVQPGGEKSVSETKPSKPGKPTTKVALETAAKKTMKALAGGHSRKARR